METGKKYKLADKCITPGGRNMTRDEDAIIEAKKYYRNDINCYNAFLHGTEFADNNPDVSSLWHDASEMPCLIKRWYLVLDCENKPILTNKIFVVKAVVYVGRTLMTYCRKEVRNDITRLYNRGA